MANSFFSKFNISGSHVGGLLSAAIIASLFHFGVFNGNTVVMVWMAMAGGVFGAIMTEMLLDWYSKREAREKERLAEMENKQREEKRLNDPYYASLMWISDKLNASEMTGVASERLRAFLTSVKEADQVLENSNLFELRMRIQVMVSHNATEAVKQYLSIPAAQRRTRTSDGISPEELFVETIDSLSQSIKQHFQDAHDNSVRPLVISNMVAQEIENETVRKDNF